MDLSSPKLDRGLARSARPFMALALFLTAAATACGSSGTKSPGSGGSPGTGGAAGKGSGGSSGGGSGGSSGGGSGGSSGGGSGGSSGGGSGGSSSGGSGGSSCANPQLTFGRIATGDTNPYFTSGVGARTATDLLVFNGYQGPEPGGDGGGPSVPYIYVQAFDRTTGTSKGHAQVLFPVADPTREGVSVEAAAVAPTGEIALLYSHANNPLYAAFLAPATGADAGVAGLTVLQSNLVVGPIFTHSGGTTESAHVFWSNAAQSFVVSWVGDAYTESISEFSATGQSMGGVAAVHTDNGTTAGNVTEASAGGSGGLLAIDWLSGIPGKNQTGITVYDTSGTQVGGFTYVASQPNGLAELAGTAKGFVLVYAPETGGLTTTGVFIPATASGLADAGTFPTNTLSIPGGTALGLLAISDDVGTGGAGGVGVALMGASSTSFAYVHADGTTVGGPVSVFGVGYQASFSQVSLTNINGSFVMTVFELTVNAGNGLPSMFTTQIAASGCD